MTDNPEQTAPPATPSDARQGDPAPAPGASDGRFPSTGDSRVDHALAQLPDPRAHHDSADAAELGGPGLDGREQVAAEDDTAEQDTASGLDLPDPALLDAHLADVTSVHRQLQQRLSDLSS
ncbi:hypothetical protein [Flexivirga sp. B27]